MQRIKISVEDGLFEALRNEAKSRGLTLSNLTSEYFFEGIKARKEKNSTYKFVKNQLYFDYLNVEINIQILKHLCKESDFDSLMNRVRNEAKIGWEENKKAIENKE